MDLSLDDIIKKERSGRGRRPAGRSQGRGGGAGRGQGRQGRGRGGAASRPPVTPYRRGNVEGRWSHDMYTEAGGGRSGGGGGGAARPRSSQDSAKLMISNLDFGVTDADIKELFGEFGPMRAAAVHYDRSGRSLGTAHVLFERRTDAVRAMKQYGGVPLDGRPMKLELATSQVASSGGGGGGGGAGARLGGGRGPRGGGRGPRGGGRGRGRGGRRPPEKKPTAEELDAELDAYVKSAH